MYSKYLYIFLAIKFSTSTHDFFCISNQFIYIDNQFFTHSDIWGNLYIPCIGVVMYDVDCIIVFDSIFVCMK